MMILNHKYHLFLSSYHPSGHQTHKYGLLKWRYDLSLYRGSCSTTLLPDHATDIHDYCMDKTERRVGAGQETGN